MLNGEVLFDTKKKTILYKSNDTEQCMEMKDVSSMVSEISPITAYLKYIVRLDWPFYRIKNDHEEDHQSSVMIFRRTGGTLTSGKSGEIDENIYKISEKTCKAVYGISQQLCV